jgi:LCP family protein required for cell wall assembly
MGRATSTMSPFRRNRILIFLAVAAAGSLTAALAASCALTRPLGEGLGFPTDTATAPPSSTSTAASIAPAGPSPVPSITPSATPAPLCGGPNTMMILGIGADSREDNYLYGLADAIRVARVDFTVPSISVLSFPRDLWVQIPEISSHYGITEGKLNQAYFYGNPGMGYYDGPGAGPGLLARTLDLNYGLRPDHYGAINMRTFVRLVDAVGGIELDLPEAVDGRPVDDQTEDMGYFPAGHYLMDGATALRYSRIRKVDNVFHRDDRQTQVLCALKKKILSPGSIGRIPQLIAAFQGSVQTDLSPAQLAQLACVAPMVKPENLRLVSVPEDMLTGTRNAQGSFIWAVDNQQLRDLVAQFVAGEWPTAPDTPSCP